MNLRMVLVLLAFAAPAQARADANIQKEKLEAGDASGLAEMLLDTAVQKEIVESRVSRLWVPGEVWRAVFLGRPQPLSADLCLRNRYRVDLKGDASGKITPGATGSPLDFAVLPVGTVATPESCAEAEGFVYAVSSENRLYQVEAYRMFRRMIHDAQGTEPLPFRLSCEGEDAEACADPRAALANLPMDALFAVSVQNVERIQKEGVSAGIYSRPPIGVGSSYTVEVSFGRSGPDGRSWRVLWQMGPRGMTPVLLKRTTVFYH